MYMYIADTKPPERVVYRHSSCEDNMYFLVLSVGGAKVQVSLTGDDKNIKVPMGTNAMTADLKGVVC